MVSFRQYIEGEGEDELQNITTTIRIWISIAEINHQIDIDNLHEGIRSRIKLAG